MATLFFNLPGNPIGSTFRSIQKMTTSHHLYFYTSSLNIHHSSWIILVASLPATIDSFAQKAERNISNISQDMLYLCSEPLVASYCLQNRIQTPNHDAIGPSWSGSWFPFWPYFLLFFSTFTQPQLHQASSLHWTCSAHFCLVVGCFKENIHALYLIPPHQTPDLSLVNTQYVINYLILISDKFLEIEFSFNPWSPFQNCFETYSPIKMIGQKK